MSRGISKDNIVNVGIFDCQIGVLPFTIQQEDNSEKSRCKTQVGKRKPLLTHFTFTGCIARLSTRTISPPLSRSNVWISPAVYDFELKEDASQRLLAFVQIIGQQCHSAQISNETRDRYHDEFHYYTNYNSDGITKRHYYWYRDTNSTLIMQTSMKLE